MEKLRNSFTNNFEKYRILCEKNYFSSSDEKESSIKDCFWKKFNED